MSNLYLFLYLQSFVKKMMVIIPGLTLYLLCPNFIPLDLPSFLDLCDQTLHLSTQQSSGHSFLQLGLLVWAILFSLSVYLIYPSVDLLISLDTWLYAISPVHQAVERLHINYHGEMLVALIKYRMKILLWPRQNLQVTYLG